MKSRGAGFTIVELLIVIVVIGILAAITVVAYNGIRNQGNNNAVIDGASKSIKAIRAYHGATGTLPATSGACITTTSTCATGSAYASNATFNTNVATYVDVPKSVPINGSTHYGVIYYYNAARTLDGIATPVVVLYWLQGTAQPCKLAHIVADPNAAATTTSSTGYSSANDSSTGKTLCAAGLPGLS